MKKISLWKMVCLYVITFGIYGIVWLAKRRSELVKKTQLAIPHWLWLVLPTVLSVAVLVAGIFGAKLAGFDGGIAIFAAIIPIGLVAALAISIWWMYRFGKAVEVVTHGKFPYLWTLLYWIFLGVVTLFAQQYWFNRIKKGSHKEKPTQRFIVLSIIVICLACVSGSVTPFLVSGPNIDMYNFDAVIQKSEEANKLNEAYTTCINKLEHDFPGDLTEDNEAAYQKGYDACEDIRLRQNKAVDELQKL